MIARPATKMNKIMLVQSSHCEERSLSIELTGDTVSVFSFLDGSGFKSSRACCACGFHGFSRRQSSQTRILSFGFCHVSAYHCHAEILLRSSLIINSRSCRASSVFPDFTSSIACPKRSVVIVFSHCCDEKQINYTSAFSTGIDFLLYWRFNDERNSSSQLLRAQRFHLRGHDPRAHGRLFLLALPLHLPRAWLGNELYRIR